MTCLGVQTDTTRVAFFLQLGVATTRLRILSRLPQGNPEIKSLYHRGALCPRFAGSELIVGVHGARAAGVGLGDGRGEHQIRMVRISEQGG